MIVDGQLLYDEPVEVEGLLIVGDPEVSSSRPGRRKDPDWPNAILAKVERCVAVANERRLALVLLGDVFERAYEKDEALKTRLIAILKGCWTMPMTNVGNHDTAHTRLSTGDSLAMLAVSDVLDAVATSGPVCTFLVGGKRIGLGMTPHGQEIPRDVSGLFPGADKVVWLTHHDIALHEDYPGAVRPFEIVGCDIAVNGHVHANKVAVAVGRTRWENPGTINRSTVDLIDLVPRAWVLDTRDTLEPVDLPFEHDVIDLTGRLVDAATTTETAASVESAFVSLLEAETSGEMARSDDASVLREEIEAKFAAESTPPDVKAIVLSLLDEAAA